MNYFSYFGVVVVVNVDDRGEVRFSSVLGKWVISFVIVFCVVLVEVLVVLVIVDNCVVVVDGLVVFGGGVNGVILVVVVEEFV